MVTRKYYNSFCEVCGRVGRRVTVDGWTTCNEHFDSEKPKAPIYNWHNGEPLKPGEDMKPWLAETLKADGIESTRGIVV